MKKLTVFFLFVFFITFSEAKADSNKTISSLIDEKASMLDFGLFKLNDLIQNIRLGYFSNYGLVERKNNDNFSNSIDSYNSNSYIPSYTDTSENPFIINDEQKKEMLSHYNAWAGVKVNVEKSEIYLEFEFYHFSDEQSVKTLPTFEICKNIRSVLRYRIVPDAVRGSKFYNKQLFDYESYHGFLHPFFTHYQYTYNANDDEDLINKLGELIFLNVTITHFRASKKVECWEKFSKENPNFKEWW